MFLTTTDITKTYAHKDGDIKALDGITLKVEKGDFVTITGASGCGKTTLLLTLGGLIQPTSGSMTFEGKQIDLQNGRTLGKYRRSHIGYVMQNFALIPYLTATENILVAFNGDKDKKSAVNRTRDLLVQVGMEHRKNHYPKELSAGQQQRVAIARSLANEPSLILADEPTGNLDPSLAKDILDLLKEINKTQRTTIIMVTHSDEAAAYGNTRIIMRDGRVLV